MKYLKEAEEADHVIWNRHASVQNQRGHDAEHSGASSDKGRELMGSGRWSSMSLKRHNIILLELKLDADS